MDDGRAHYYAKRMRSGREGHLLWLYSLDRSVGRSVGWMMRASKQPFASRTISVLLTFAAVVVFASHIAANVDRQRTRKWENYTKDEKEAELS